ncbi:MAG: folylpolyglutamate synthase/dihydrofolate synthase family protein [bacterium]|nr:folylpolyglutamate synthase/dihydrofolate synthase family protein [bacterium]
MKKFLNYKDCIDYLFNLERRGVKYDLTNIRKLLRFSGNPHRNFRSIHIAGTNGKGSVSSIIYSILIESKIKAGLYTSPHILDFRERIQVNGKFVSKKFVLDFTARLFDEIERIKPSFFEVTTAMAFEYFSFMKVKYAVIETGLGGRLDSTNIITPLLSVITAISLDHTDYLGKTIKSITYEKGGIIKKNVPVVIGNLSGHSSLILKKTAKKNNSPFILSHRKNISISKRDAAGFHFSADNLTDVLFPVTGDYQQNNIQTALASIEVLGEKEKLNFKEEHIKKGFENVKKNSHLNGRFEKISDDPSVIIDVSHNLQAIKNIRNNLKYFKYKKLFVIFAMMADKDFKSCLNEIDKLGAEKVVITKPDYRRAAEPDQILRSLKVVNEKYVLNANVKTSYEYVSKLATKNDLILVTGSFFLVSDFLDVFNKA